MTFDVIVLKQPDNGFLARTLLLPEVTAQGATEQEALDQISALIRGQFEKFRLVKLEVDLPEARQNPWSARAGIFANDPTWDDFQEVMAEHRRQIDADPNEP